MKYKILVADNMADLEDYVNAHIADGWIPVGGVAINEYEDPTCSPGTQRCYAQAMTNSN